MANNITNSATVLKNANQVTLSALNASDPDKDGSIASYRIASLPTAGTLYYNNNGTYTAVTTAGLVLTPVQARSLRYTASGTAGNVTFTYAATDNTGIESNNTATYTIEVKELVVAANNDSNEVPKNTAVTGNVILNDLEPNYRALTAAIVTNPTRGTVTMNANGVYTYTPQTGYTGADSFTYRVCSSVNASSCATATVNLRVYDPGAACTSSTGTNLLINPDFTDGNTGFASDYNYVSPTANAATTNGNQGLVPENTYAVDANANSYHGTFRGTDYDGTGKFLMINGSATIQRMYAQTITVEPNRYYTFSAYFNNLLAPGSNSAVPEVGFAINGTGVSSTLQVQESPDRWVRYSSIWYSGNNTTAIFEIRNVSTAAGGNDLGIDHIYFGTCNVAPIANNDLQTTLPGTNITFSAISNDVDGDGTLNKASVNLNPSSSTRQTTMTVSGKGTFTVDDNGSVTFAPVAGFIGTVSIPYTVLDNDGAASNPGTLSVTVQYPPTDLVTTISANPRTSVTAGQSLTYTVVATNNGPAIASNVQETLQLPAGLTNNGNAVTFTINGTANTSPSYNNATGAVTFPAIATLASGASTTYGITVKAPGAGPITAVAGIVASNSETNTSNNTASTTVAVSPVYDVATTITGPSSVVTGNLATFTVTTSNRSTTGALSTAPNVLQTVQIPKNLTGVYASNNGNYDAATGIVSFPVLAALPLGQTVVNTVSFSATAGFTATASATANYTVAGTTNNVGDLASTNNNQTATATVVTAATTAKANITATITTSTPTATPNGTASVTVQALNNGPSTATGVVQQVSLLPGLAVGSTLTGLPAGATYDPNTGVVTLATASLASGAQQTATLQFTLPASGYVLAATNVSTTTSDLVMADNAASTQITIGSVTDVTTALAGPTSALAGQRVSYMVTTANNSGAVANNVVQSVSIPAGLTDVIVSNGGTYNEATGVVTFTLNSVPTGSQQVNSISFSTSSTGSFLATASVSTTTPEGTGTATTNNRATVTTTVQPSVDVVVSVNGPVTATVFSPATYVVVATNNGPNTAASVTPTLQLPAGLTVISKPSSANYNSTTGLVTFATVNDLAAGVSNVNSITVVMPDVAQMTGLAQAAVTGTADRNEDNNRASTTTPSTTPTDRVADLRVTLGSSASSVTAGQSITLTATFANGAFDAAANAVPQLSLPAGLTITSGDISNGGSYNAATGLVTWPTINSMAVNASVNYTVKLTAPGIGPVVAAASFTSETSDPVANNNAATTSVTITPQADVATVVSGPTVVAAGSTVTYSVVTLNNGASPATAVVQKVTLPVGVTAGNLPAGASQSGNTITFATIGSQAAGAAGEVTNTFTITVPTTAYAITANVVTSTTESTTGNNSSTVNSTMFNQPPVAQNIVNSLQTPQGNTAGQLFITELAATDADGSVSTYAINPASLPSSNQGTLYYNNGGTYSVLPTTGAAIPLTPAQARTLKFDPAADFRGNVFFTYTATDNAGSTSIPALYTLPVGIDNAATYSVLPAKGGVAPYANNDVLAYVVDNNGALYTNAGAVYDATTGNLNSGARNGLPTLGNTNATISAADRTLLNNAGIDLNSTTGQFFVSNRALLRQNSYTVSVTTTDLYGGVTTQNVTIPVGARPLPVTLVSFTAQAAGADAKLLWRTSQELNNERFVVERSFNGTSFQAIGQVQGQGTSAQAHDYAFSDRGVGSQAAGTVYYRLRQVDTDGTSSLSPVQVVRFAKALTAEVAVYPNPTSNTADTRLDLSALPAGTYRVLVTDMAGRSVRSFTQAGGTNQSLDVRDLPLGSYLLTVEGNGQRFTQRLVKE
ncbi:Ig-like domain-containing protein [Hymenobacter sediminis]|uniref:Ig-like domain-containing protein n=1 Tax=Hymenobacter sediminis TaxID=2218621 RepID=UPI001EE3D39D|nr:Ig-like domain-containing protein [Hymenobacter sediminis]